MVNGQTDADGSAAGSHAAGAASAVRSSGRMESAEAAPSAKRKSSCSIKSANGKPSPESKSTNKN